MSPCRTLHAQLQRRAMAASRLVGGDPLSTSERVTGRADADRPPLTTKQIDGWSAAARFLLSHDLTPLVPAEVLRALHRRGGADRALVELLQKPATHD